MCKCKNNKYKTNRYSNRGVNDSGYMTIWDNFKKKEFTIEAMSSDSFSNNGYDEEYYCIKCKEVGFYELDY